MICGICGNNNFVDMGTWNFKPMSYCSKCGKISIGYAPGTEKESGPFFDCPPLNRLEKE